MTLAYACMIGGTGKRIAPYGRTPEKIQAEVLDLQHGLRFVRAVIDQLGLGHLPAG